MLWMIFSTLAFASPTATTVTKNGSCPSGYSSSGNYCKPNSGARFAIEKNGSCPSGYSSSGRMLANSGASLAIHKKWFVSIRIQQFRELLFDTKPKNAHLL